MRGWRARATFDPARGSARTWLFTITRRVIADAARSRGRLPQRLTDGEADHLPTPDRDPTDRLVLLEALLDESKREAVVAVQREGLSSADYAERCGVSVPTLRTRVHDGLRALRSHLDETEAADD